MASDKNGENGNGREANGRFAKGNPGGPGNPNIKALHAHRMALYSAITEEDIRAVLLAMRDEAIEERSAAAARVYLEYACGKPRPIDDDEELDESDWVLVESDAGEGMLHLGKRPGPDTN